ncbi:sulfatase-like hydrolase/transferase [Tundrisphaera lichenicola]|uniref:sulfatase n=1 Tax=Tundrisphaera lichenicola TaxID=2029860 RepID=UPI003EB8D689
MATTKAEEADQIQASGSWEGSLSMIGLAVWVGLAVGLVEVGLFLVQVRYVQAGYFRRSPNVLWMIPLADALMVGLFGAALTLLVRPVPKVGRRLASLLLCSLVIFVPLLAIPGLKAVASLILAVGIASWVEPILRSRAESVRRLAWRTLPVLILTVLSLVGITFGREWLRTRNATAPVATPPGAPNVLLIVMDTVRADATSLNENGRDSTPNLAALARRGARFDRAISTAPWTLPSHASMFTGKTGWELEVGPDRALDDRYPTLAEYFGRHGYATGGFAANTSLCTVEYGLARGFGHYEDYALTPVDFFRSSAFGWLVCHRLGDLLDRGLELLGREPSHMLEGRLYRKDAARINRDALRWISRRQDRPFFAFLNYFDAHDPYLLPSGAERPSGRGTNTLAERKVLRDWIGDAPKDRPPGDFALARDAYQDCLSYLDGKIGRLIEGLDRMGGLENTIVIITSDHGEHFGEHRRAGFPLVGHGLSVYQPELHVPLLIVAPGRIPTGTVVPGVVSLRDLAATVVDLAGIEEGSPFPGRSLLKPIEPGTVATALAEFSPWLEDPVGLRYQGGASGVMRAYVSDDASFHRHGDGQEESYDLRADPKELHDLSDTGDPGGLFQPLRRLMDELDRTIPARSEVSRPVGP